MDVDRHTLLDLEIFPKHSGDFSICEFLDTTRTEGGRRCFKELLASPLKSIPAIEERRKLLTYLVTHGSHWKYALSDSLMKAVEEYLQSNIIPISTKNRCLLLIERWRHRENFRQLSEGLQALRSFLLIVRELYEQHHAFALPDELSSLLRDFEILVEQRQISSFLDKSPSRTFSAAEAYGCDRLFRQEFREAIERLLTGLYRLDAFLSLAQKIEAQHLTFPSFVASESPLFHATGLYHPCLQSPVPYDLRFGDGKHFLFLTGPNMAGKTTLMKACGIAVYLAHLGMAVPAQSLTLTFYDGLMSDIHTEDNIRLGYSYFYSEVKRVKEIAGLIRQKKSVFLLLDELFKGTNVHDAYEASKRVIQGFARWPQHQFILSSHLVELEPEIDKQRRFFAQNFDVQWEQGKPAYTYQLKDGISRTRLGLVILEQERVFELLNAVTAVLAPASCE